MYVMNGITFPDNARIDNESVNANYTLIKSAYSETAEVIGDGTSTPAPLVLRFALVAASEEAASAQASLIWAAVKDGGTLERGTRRRHIWRAQSYDIQHAYRNSNKHIISITFLPSSALWVNANDANDRRVF